MDIHFEFAIGDNVAIKISGLAGHVEALFFGLHSEKSYRVKYADRDGAVLNQWFEEADLLSVQESK